MDVLMRNGVPVMALARDADGQGYAIGVAKVEKCGRRFVARDEDGEPADLVAWLPKDGWFGPWSDALPLLGMQVLYAPRLNEPLSVFLDPFDWFRNGRAGVVILDGKRAWRALEGASPSPRPNCSLGSATSRWVTCSRISRRIARDPAIRPSMSCARRISGRRRLRRPEAREAALR